MPRPLVRATFSLLLALCLSGCANWDYYGQSVRGHLQIVSAARPVAQWLADDAAPERLKQQLQSAQRIRAFASAALGLPDNASYTRYADLRRDAALWNVVAAPALSLTLKTWCFPVAGCVAYRGYYDLDQAQALARELRDQGWDVAVYPVPAYSTLGWSNALGGDPLLNTFIDYPQTDLARLIFHELAHQVVYVKDDTSFNESFATAVERLGLRQWLQTEAGDAPGQDHAQSGLRREQFRTLTRLTRDRLVALYAAASPADNESRLSHKQRIFEDFRAQYGQMRQAWGGDPARFAQTDRWVAQANNAALGADAAYDTWVPGFEALFEQAGRQWPQFYDAVRQLAQLPAERRRQILKDLARA